MTRQRRRAESSALPKHCDTDTPSRWETKRRNRAQRRVGRLEASDVGQCYYCNGPVDDDQEPDCGECCPWTDTSGSEEDGEDTYRERVVA